MPRNKSGSANGGIIGKTNRTSFGKDTVQIKTSSGCFSATQPGTRFVNAVVVGGGGGGGLAQNCSSGSGGG